MSIFTIAVKDYEHGFSVESKDEVDKMWKVHFWSHSPLAFSQCTKECEKIMRRINPNYFIIRQNINYKYLCYECIPQERQFKRLIEEII